MLNEERNRALEALARKELAEDHILGPDRRLQDRSQVEVQDGTQVVQPEDVLEDRPCEAELLELRQGTPLISDGRT